MIMVPQGRSGKTLVQKLGIKHGQRVAFLNPPKRYEEILGKIPDEITVADESTEGLDLVQLFAEDGMGLEKNLPVLKSRIKRNGVIWISWRKASSRLGKDLDEHVVRRIGLANGLVDVKVCAVDETWSALKFVIRAKDR